MAYFLHPPDLIHAQDFIHAELNVWIELALNPYGVDNLVMVANNPSVLSVSDVQELRPDGLIHFKVRGNAIGYSFLDACVGKDGPSWGKTQVIVGQGCWSPPPRQVRQVASWTCWAASMESYLSTRSRGAQWTQSYLVDEYGVGENGYRGQLLPRADTTGKYEKHRNAVTLYSDLGIVYDDWTGPRFTFDYIYKVLGAQKYLLLTYNAGHLADGTEYAHVVVAYACRREPPPYGETVSVMDPNEGGNYDTWPISHFQQYSKIIVAWQR